MSANEQRDDMRQGNNICFSCGESLGEAQGEGHTSSHTILCADCEHVKEQPISHFYLNQYYYRYAD